MSFLKSSKVQATLSMIGITLAVLLFYGLPTVLAQGYGIAYLDAACKAKAAETGKPIADCLAEAIGAKKPEQTQAPAQVTYPPTSGAPSNVFWAVTDRVVIIYIQHPSMFPELAGPSASRTNQIRDSIKSIGENWEIRSIATTTGFEPHFREYVPVTESLIIVVDGPKKPKR